MKTGHNGHDIRHYRNVHAYVSDCWRNGAGVWYVNNTCAANRDTRGFKSGCGRSEIISGNRVYNRNGTLLAKDGGAQPMCNGNTIAALPEDDELIEWGLRTIGVRIERPALV